MSLINYDHIDMEIKNVREEKMKSYKIVVNTRDNKEYILKNNWHVDAKFKQISCNYSLKVEEEILSTIFTKISKSLFDLKIKFSEIKNINFIEIGG